MRSFGFWISSVFGSYLFAALLIGAALAAIFL